MSTPVLTPLQCPLPFQPRCNVHSRRYGPVSTPLQCPLRLYGPVSTPLQCPLPDDMAPFRPRCNVHSRRYGPFRPPLQCPLPSFRPMAYITQTHKCWAFITFSSQYAGMGTGPKNVILLFLYFLKVPIITRFKGDLVVFGSHVQMICDSPWERVLML